MINQLFDPQLLSQDSGLLQSCCILFCALILARFVPIPRDLQPLLWFNRIAVLLATKVNHPERAVSQQLTAGILATLILVVPCGIIVSFLLSLAAYPWFFELIILYFCLCDSAFKPVAENIVDAIKTNNKQDAKQLLAPWTSQNTNVLSEVGLSKATIEKLFTTPIYGTLATILFFALGGAVMTLVVRMLRQLEHSWPPYHPHFHVFASFIGQFNRVIFFIPTLLWHCSLAIQFGQLGLKSIWSSIAPPACQQLNNHYGSYALAANLLKIELGGPQQFIENGISTRVDLAKVKAGPLPDHRHISQAITITQTANLFWISLTLLLPLIWAGLRFL
ncbi:cobalamin biosynthesis protein CobD/CbiB [Shewanella saliphila]|uniref:Cobalamin biosynthesis protein CbiB n=1 Tax=Shewanella saliphila TaxID=2282698 RepID=A0ABQ2Q3M5_9GAMM|nr:cobalamin biosynthesis protein [Shewanella saliphila]MCL1100535.1 cobalamin biosynthesis protein [Shewanella saliphila]GGP40831.1 cobalamin biosynthesis protein CbiB [Shewanella saliphila]